MTRLLSLLAAAAMVAALPATAQHAGHDMPPPAASADWTKLPLVNARPLGRAGAEISIANSAATGIVVTPPKGEAATLQAIDGSARFKPGVGNYHLATAVDACDAHVATATTALYFSNPGPAPTAILDRPGQGLTVLPERLPREHGAYRAGETWPFRVRFDGQPFPGAKVRFETANGTRQELVSDLDGRVAVTFPDDFPPRGQRPPEGHGRPVQAAFAVAAISQTGALQHVGSFNLTYRPGAYDGMSLWAGAGFGVVGMMAAAPLLRRRKGGRP